MRILAVDTATESCSVAILDQGRILVEINRGAGQTHARHLMPMIGQAAQTAKVGLADLQGLALTRGPGSFTGLRIGISTIKGLAVALNLPVVAVSTLEVLAGQAAVPDHRICPLVDARKKEIYCAGYRLENGHLARIDAEAVMPPQAFADTLQGRCILVGNGALLYADVLIRKGDRQRLLAPRSQHLIRAATIGQLSLSRFENGQTIDVADLKPVYIRPSDARIHPRMADAIQDGRQSGANACSVTEDIDNYI